MPYPAAAWSLGLLLVTARSIIDSQLLSISPVVRQVLATVLQGLRPAEHVDAHAVLGCH